MSSRIGKANWLGFLPFLNVRAYSGRGIKGYLSESGEDMKQTAWIIVLLVIITFWIGAIECVFSSYVHASEPPVQVRAIIGEAEGEGYTGMLAIAGAIRNRGTLKGVYGLHAPRVRKHLYSQHTLALATQAWIASRSLDITKGATGWGSAKDVEIFKKSSWWPSVYFTAHIGNHYFYGTDG